MRTSNTMRMIQLSGAVALASGDRINEAADKSCCVRSKTRRANAAANGIVPPCQVRTIAMRSWQRCGSQQNWARDVRFA
jgi:hypothetical protein